jgi:hypothetical protein
VSLIGDAFGSKPAAIRGKAPVFDRNSLIRHAFSVVAQALR